MAQHEFGLMNTVPKPGQRYDEYEPWKYGCISVDDGCLDPILEELGKIGFYWHTLDVPGRGLAVCGITLIPPEALAPMLGVLSGRPELENLRCLLLRAQAEHRYVIHFGL